LALPSPPNGVIFGVFVVSALLSAGVSQGGLICPTEMHMISWTIGQLGQGAKLDHWAARPRCHPVPSAGIDRARARAKEPCQCEAAADGIMPGQAQRPLIARSCASYYCACVRLKILHTTD